MQYLIFPAHGVRQEFEKDTRPSCVVDGKIWAKY